MKNLPLWHDRVGPNALLLVSVLALLMALFELGIAPARGNDTRLFGAFIAVSLLGSAAHAVARQQDRRIRRLEEQLETLTQEQRRR
jgi:hypothetical protein